MYWRLRKIRYEKILLVDIAVLIIQKYRNIKIMLNLTTRTKNRAITAWNLVRIIYILFCL
jgi:hypothetical protein